jgi:hypothetical protein
MICFKRFCGLNDPTDKMLVPVGWRRQVGLEKTKKDSMAMEQQNIL